MNCSTLQYILAGKSLMFFIAAPSLHVKSQVQMVLEIHACLQKCPVECLLKSLQACSSCPNAEQCFVVRQYNSRPCLHNNRGCLL